MESVLVTGGTGSFGRRFIWRFLNMDGSRRIAVYSRGEHAQEDMSRRIAPYDDRNNPLMRFFIGDVRDRSRLKMAMKGVDTVVHAAALKVVPLMEANPSEAVMTNITGADNVIHAAMESGVRKVVALSTDKACGPVNLYGATKLVAEKMFVAASQVYSGNDGPKFAVVRYGNIAGSRGSVIPLWKSMTGPVPVTDPACTRFWMTLDQSVELVMWTIRNMIGGEIVVPDMPAFTIGDLAAAMGREVRVVGMRPGEKKHETIISEHELFSRVTPAEKTSFGDLFVVNRWPVADGHNPMSSDNVRRLTVDEIRTRLAQMETTDAPV